MFRIARAPPVVGLALAAGAGAALNHLGVPLPWTLLSLTLLLRPTASSPGPRSSPVSLSLILAFMAGGMVTHQWAVKNSRDCRLDIRENQALRVRGRIMTRVMDGRGRLRIDSGLPGGCTPSIRFFLTSSALKAARPPTSQGETTEVQVGGVHLPPGSGILLVGRWRRGRVGPRDDPLWSGYLRVDQTEVGREEVGGEEVGGWPDLVEWRGRVQRRLGELYPDQGALVEALVLARKEGLSASIRESFASAGTAHLLAISGFHVGVVAGILLLLGGWMGLSHPLRFLFGSMGVWAYVLFIGLPDAALRAALILTLLATGRLFRRPVAPLGALASAFLAFLLLDPGALLRPGFQLSFSGAVGLVVWGEPLARSMERLSPLRGRRLLVSALAAGLAATLATLPLVAWHFGRASVVGIPVTLLGAPLVTLAIPGILLSLLLSGVAPPLGFLLAQGVEVILWVLVRLVQWAGDLPFAAIWISRPGVVAGTVGVFLGFLWHRVRPSPGLKKRGRGIRLALGIASGLLVWPAAELVFQRGTLEVVMLDVGQGDAIALRSPGGRWILVDAGPRTQTFDAGARRVLPFLRRRGVGEVELLVLTHPDMDHVGGAGAVLHGIPVKQVLDPGRVVDTDVFFHALEGAEEQGAPWGVACIGDSLNLDGVAIRVLWPPKRNGPPGESSGNGPGQKEAHSRALRAIADRGNNEASVVLEVLFGEFSLLLTGDAPSEVEGALIPLLLSPRAQVLKVGHHGSSTSTAPELLERLSPSVALISAGMRNRYGHPDASVLRRLEAQGAEVFRTDEDGTVVLKAWRNGQFKIRRLTKD